MLDPVSAIGMATAAYNGIKSAIQTGKEISDLGSELGKWAQAVSDLDYNTQKLDNPPMFKKVLAGNLEQQALEAWAHKRKAEEMREELRQYISLYYGPSAWDEIVHIEAQMRKERKKAEYAQIERKEAIQQGLFIIGAFIVGLAVIGGIIWWIGVQRGTW